jgi:hypothetical protein
MGRDISVGVATGYWLDGPGFEFRWGRDSAPINTGPGAHTAFITVGTGSIPLVKRPGRDVGRPPDLSSRLNHE